MKILLKPAFIISIIAVIFVTGIVLSINVSAEENLIPSWVKNNAGWWADGTIDDNSFIQGIQFLIDTGVVIVPEIDNLKMENAELQKQNDELLVQLDEGRIIIEDLVLVIEENITEKTITSAPESTGLSGQSIPDRLWFSVNAEYYDNRYERLIVEIYSSDKYEKTFVFKQGHVDVVVWFEKEHEERTASSAVKKIVSVPVVVMERTIEFSESDYPNDTYKKLVLEIEGCLPARDQYLGKTEIRYFIETTISSDMGDVFGPLTPAEFTVSVGPCQG